MKLQIKHEDRETLRWVLRSTGRCKYLILTLIPLQSILTLTHIFFALYMRDLVDSAAGKNMDGFIRAALLIVGLMILRILCTALLRFLHEWTSSGVENTLRTHVFRSLLTKDYSSVSAIHSGEWMNRLISDVGTVTSTMVDVLPGLIATLLGLFGAVIALTSLQPLFTAILLPGGVVLLVVSYLFRRLMKRMHKAVREADGRVRVFLQERLGSLMIVKTFGMESTVTAVAEEKMAEYRGIRMRRNHISNFCNTSFVFAVTMVYMGGTVYCGYQILLGAMTYGTMMAIMDLVGQVQGPLSSITGYLPQFYNMIASAERLTEIENFADDCMEPKTAETVADCYRNQLDSLGLNHVTFQYAPPVQEDGRQMPTVLQELSFNLKKGEYAALMGHSGCGKSTILKLLMGLYPIESGSRYLQKTDGGREELDASWRGLFAYVPQGNQLMSGSIREIIAFGDPEKMRQEEALQRALHIACADEFIGALPDGIDTVLGERGAGLSEGQTQRIAIARAIFSDRPILLLDESTSALDEITEKNLLANLRSMTDKTVIIVTHRTAVLSVCDRQVTITESGIQTDRETASAEKEKLR